MPSFFAAPQPRRGLFLSAALAAALLSACSREPAPPEPLRAVKLVTVGASDLVTALEYAAEVRARVESRLAFRVAGKLVLRPVELGQSVRPGTLLAQLDAQDYALAAQAAQAQLAAAATQRDLAAADLRRFSQLKAQNFISGAELERRQTQFNAAQAQWEQARAQAQAQGHQQDYTRLVADVAGVVTAVEAEPGQVLSAGQTVLRLAQDGARDVAFAVPEDKIARLQVGQAVTVRAWGDAPHTTWAARVRDVAASADPVTRTFAVKAALEGTDLPPLGATVYAQPQAFSRAGTQAIVLPTSALRQDGGKTAVWVFDPPTSSVQSQAVEIASADENQAVIAAGLQPGMQVVATGVHVLSAGQKVTIYAPKYAQKTAPALTEQAQTAINLGASKSATESPAESPKTAPATPAAGQ